MKDEELIEMKEYISSISSDNCIMFMWATMPRLDFAIELMKHWWFDYKTIWFTRVKLNKDWTYRVNPWYYTASNVELVLIGIKWKNNWRFKPNKTMINQIVATSIREHSRKPDEVRDRINLMYPDLNKIELFARTKVQGRDARWNEVDKF